jgi:transposase
MRIIGCDLHARQQTLAMLETTTGEVVNLTLMHEGNNVREFYSSLARPVLVGIEATGSMLWFLNLMDELGIESRSAIPPRFMRRNRANRNMTGAMRI